MASDAEEPIHNLDQSKGAAQPAACEFAMPGASDGAAAGTSVTQPRVLLHVTMLVLILGLAAALRFAWLDHPSYEMDEFWHVELATGRGSAHMHLPRDVIMDAPELTRLQGAPPWYAVWTNMEQVTHPPLYPQLLRLWGELFSFSDFALRAFSAVVSVLGVLALYDVARHLHGRNVALWASLIMAVAGTQITMSQQVRSYTLLVLFALIAAAALVRIETRGPRTLRYLALGAGVLAMMLTHYFGIGVAVALVLYAGLRLAAPTRVRVAATLAIAALLYLLVWGPLLWEQREVITATTDNWLKDDASGHLLRTAGYFAALPLRLLFEPQDKSYPIVYFAVVLYIIPLLMLRKRRDLLLWVLWLAGTIGLIAALDVARSTWHLALVRYTFLASPAIYIILAALMAHQKPWLRQAVPALCALCSILALQAAYISLKPDWRGMAKYLDASATPQDIVAYYRSDDVDWFDQFMCMSITHYRQEDSRVVLLSGPANAPLAEQLREVETVWLITRSATMFAQQLLPDARVEHEIFIPGVGVCQRLSLP